MASVICGKKTSSAVGRKLRKILALVEGQTEERFIKQVLDPYLHQRGHYIVARILVTKQVKDGPNFKGGVRSYHQVSDDLRRLLGDSSAHVVTTMFDFYRLPSDFPGYSGGGPFRSRINAILEAWRNAISDSRFVPYLSTHEYEALIFRYPDAIAHNTGLAMPPAGCTSWRNCDDPESVNNAEPPAKRIERHFPSYIKRLHGPLTARDIGIDEIRKHGQFFHRWLNEIAPPQFTAPN